jgi:type I restriction enzyme S subunit
VSINAFPCQTNQQINSIVLNKQIHREYLYFLCKSLKVHLENLGSNGATMGNVNKEKFQTIKVLYPDEKILEHYSNICAPMFQQIKDLQLKNQNLAATRDLLLPKLISGELDISELDIKVSEVEA